MISKTLAITFAIGIVVITLAVAGIFRMQRGAHMVLPGTVLKVRTAPLDENSTIAVVDFRFANPGNVPFWVRTVSLVMEEKDGRQYEGSVVSEMDAKRLFEAMPLLGTKYNDTLVLRDKIPAHTSADRMVAARFEAPEARINGRKRFIVRVEEVDGAVSEISEK